MTTFKYSDNAATRYNESFLLDAGDVYKALANEYDRSRGTEHGIEVRHMRNRADGIAQAAGKHAPVSEADITWIAEMWHQAKAAKRI